MKIQHSKQTRVGFYEETQNGKITGRSEEDYLFVVLQEGFLFISIRLLFFLRPPLVEECLSTSKLFSITDGADPSS